MLEYNWDAVGIVPFVWVGTTIQDDVSLILVLGDLSCHLLTIHRLSDKVVRYSAY